MIGADPDLIRPGQVLTVPVTADGAGAVSADVGAVVLAAWQDARRGRLRPGARGRARARAAAPDRIHASGRRPTRGARRSGWSPPSPPRSSRRRPGPRTRCPRPRPAASRSCASATGRSSWRPTTTTPRPLPDGDPSTVARAVALASLEVLAGRRSVAQLARWLTPGVYESLQVRAGLTQRVLGTTGGTRPPVIRRSRACRVDSHVLEASLVADDGVRVRAVALRLEAHRGAWRVTALEIG